MGDWYEMSDMTSREFAQASSSIRLALVPVGATEQHGPNLGLGTDYVIAHRFCQPIAQALHPRAIVLPPVPLGLSYHHMGFPGTLSFSPETFTAVCMDIARSPKQQGIDHVLFVNGHNGNTAVLNVAATKIRYDLDMQAAVAFWFQQAGDVVKKHARTERYGQSSGRGSAAEESLRLFFGLDQPLWQQYAGWLWGAVQGDLGTSWVRGRQVLQLVLNAFMVTLQLGLMTLVFATIIGVPLGLVAGLYEGRRIDSAIQAFNVIGLSAPVFWLGQVQQLKG